MRLFKIVFSPTGGAQNVADILADVLAKELGINMAIEKAASVRKECELYI